MRQCTGFRSRSQYKYSVLVRQGRYPGQLLLLLIYLEAVPRLRAGRFPAPFVWLIGITVMLSGYELLGLRYHEDWGNVVLWMGAFTVAGVWGALRLREETSAMPAPAVATAALTDMRADTAPAEENHAEVPMNQSPARVRLLTRQQQQVLRLAAAGLSVTAIAYELSVSPETVRAHLRDSYRRLGVHSRAEAIQQAQQRGYLT